MLQTLKNTVWHPTLAFWGGLRNGFPAHHMTVVGVTGTKGKSTVSDMLYRILSEAGQKTALASTIRFAYPGFEEPNRFKMTMPGRGYLQGFLARARRAGATTAVIEITSEGAKQSRHRFLELDCLVVTNIEKEHIESHGSFEKYIAAKRAIVRELERSGKKRKALVANVDNPHTAQFLEEVRGVSCVPFSKQELASLSITLPFPGEFNRMNALAAIKAGRFLGVNEDASKDALAAMPQVKGRVEPVNLGQPFKVIVDYAHTPDSLTALYSAFPERKICVLGNTGGGRDTWKRPEMGGIADKACDVVILTNEDPYDEDPEKIVEEMVGGMKRQPEIIMDRRRAIARAFSLAQPGDAVLITGKGTDPFIMERGGTKTPWSDSVTAREELYTLGYRESGK